MKSIFRFMKPPPSPFGRRDLVSPARVAVAAAGFLVPLVPLAHGADLGVFAREADIGSPAHRGSMVYDADKGAYTITGGGANMWATNDAFHFIWKEISGDLALTAEIAWPRAGGDPHRKAVLLIRQGLEPDAIYADAAFHGNGLTSLQFRDEKGGPTREIQSGVTAPRVLRIERRGDVVSMSIGSGGERPTPAGGSCRFALHDPVLVGLGVCAHNDAVEETAVFSRVRLEPLPAPASTNRVWESTLEVVNVASADRRAVHVLRDHFEAPNWSPDGQWLLYNHHGRLYRIPASGGAPKQVDTGTAIRCNNDHGFSPDGTQIAISDQSENGRSLVYVLPAGGGMPRRVTESGPSYWHGWSPDGRTLAYCAERAGEFDIYTIPAAGGTEARLTTAAGLDDGPDYSPDGNWIYFNSERTGLMQVWRMHPDGSGQEQAFREEANDWFPHPSPNGRWLAYLVYAKDVKGHPANQEVEIRVRPLTGGPARMLARLLGGQGTINVPSWSPDSQQLAFVSYRFVPEETRSE